MMFPLGITDTSWVLSTSDRVPLKLLVASFGAVVSHSNGSVGEGGDAGKSKRDDNDLHGL
jgi:hypothetical protein